MGMPKASMAAPASVTITPSINKLTYMRAFPLRNRVALHWTPSFLATGWPPETNARLLCVADYR